MKDKGASGGQLRLALIVSILASFVAFLDASVVNVALPAIMRELGGGLATQQWVIDAYLVTLGALMLIAGSLSDLLGRKRVMLAGLVGFGVTSVFCALAPSAILLIASRALQGAAGALLVPSSLALIISTFPSSEQGKAIGKWTAWTGIAFVVGPLLGGFLVDAASWRLIFAINVVPIVITVWLLGLLRAPEHERGDTKIDTMGAILCAAGLGGPVFALIEHARFGWGSPVIYLPLALGLATLGYFLWYEHKAAHPMLPLELLKIRNFGIGNIATACIYGGLSVATFLIVVFVQQVGGYSAIQAGVALLPVTLIMFVLSPRIGALSSKFGPRWFMALGPLIGSLGFLSMLRMGTPINYWTELFPGVIIFGVGLSITVAPLTAAILGAIDARRAGIGSAINNAVARVSGLVAIAAIGLVTGPTLALAGFHRGVITMALLLAAGGIISAIGIQNLRKSE